MTDQLLIAPAGYVTVALFAKISGLSEKPNNQGHKGAHKLMNQWLATPPNPSTPP